MSVNAESLILEQFGALCDDLKDFRQDTREELQAIKMRLNSVERTVSGAHDDNVIVQMRIDKVDEKIDKIEKRLELAA